MADEYIRLDTTIMGIDGLINEAPTGSQARALLCAKDMIYDQQRYVSEMKPVKHAKWILFAKDEIGRAFYCSNCRKATTTEDFENSPLEREEYFCSRCGADMRNE